MPNVLFLYLQPRLYGFCFLIGRVFCFMMPVANRHLHLQSIVAQPSILLEAAQGTTPEAAKDATELMAADLNKEKAAPTADAVASSSKPASWTDHVSASVPTYA